MENNLYICGLSKKCKIKRCIHKIPHTKSDACLGLCIYMGYPTCFKLAPKKEEKQDEQIITEDVNNRND